MKNVVKFLSSMAVMALFPAVSGAVGTYYNGNLYQNPQQRYSRGGYYNSYGYGSGRTYEQQQSVQSGLGNQKQQKQKAKQQNVVKDGFVLNAGLSHQVANWEFNMNNAGSRLHYDDIAWNVFDLNGVYYFGGNTKMQVKAGFQYGKQYGESPMADDDITSGGGLVETYYYVDDYGDAQVLGYQTGHALSIGASKGGSQTGFNVAFGLTDYWSWKNLKITPSVGYRYFKHKLTTERNYGTNIDIFESDYLANCIEVQAGEVQCNPFLLFISDGGEATVGQFLRDETTGSIIVDPDGNFIIGVPGGTKRLDVGETYYYEQYGTSHIYETTWSGPYVAFDVEYKINEDNMITGGIELGLPIYHSKGDQPYRYDWAHPTSVEDEGNFGDAYHFGMLANWVTNITDSTTLSLGVTYDYYKVSDATAKTYLNAAYYSSELTAVNNKIATGTLTADELAYYQDVQSYLYQLQSGGWTLEDKSEINSVYKSMGMRIGVNMKF